MGLAPSSEVFAAEIKNPTLCEAGFFCQFKGLVKKDK